MKITVNQLRRIIKEEISRVILENQEAKSIMALAKDAEEYHIENPFDILPEGLPHPEILVSLTTLAREFKASGKSKDEFLKQARARFGIFFAPASQVWDEDETIDLQVLNRIKQSLERKQSTSSSYDPDNWRASPTATYFREKKANQKFYGRRS